MSGPAAGPLVAEYAAACVEGDLHRAHEVVLDAVGAGFPAGRIGPTVVAPAMRQVGDLWERGELGVAEEHMATAITQSLLARLAPMVAPDGRHGGLAVVACVPRDEHTVGARIVADELTWAGWRVLFLGGPIPHDEILRVVVHEQPDVLALSCTIAHHAPAARAIVTDARATQRPALCLIGGQAGAVLHEVGADIVAPPGVSCAELLRGLCRSYA
jgi:methanogenic corrinoid protein MtbC1